MIKKPYSRTGRSWSPSFGSPATDCSMTDCFPVNCSPTGSIADGCGWPAAMHWSTRAANSLEWRLPRPPPGWFWSSGRSAGRVCSVVGRYWPSSSAAGFWTVADAIGRQRLGGHHSTGCRRSDCGSMTGLTPHYSICCSVYRIAPVCLFGKRKRWLVCGGYFVGE